MRLLRKITYGEFSEFVQEKKVHIVFTSSVDGGVDRQVVSIYSVITIVSFLMGNFVAHLVINCTYVIAFYLYKAIA